jgi:membrane-bound inhibitor of C-type lysozyme
MAFSSRTNATLAFSILFGCLAACDGPDPDLGETYRSTLYHCEDGSTLIIEYGQGGDRASIQFGSVSADLERKRAGSGFLYEGPGHTLRGKGDEAVWTSEPGSPVKCTASTSTHSKIQFDLDSMNENGLVGPPDGLRALSYEFCVPGDAATVDEVTRIDPTIQVQHGSPGRAGCSGGEALCLGHTHQPEFRRVLQELASLRYVRAIQESHFE